MVTFHQTGTKTEQERIRATFGAGHAHCYAAVLTFLHALAMLLLFVVHVLTFAINFSIGVLMCLHAVVCMARLLLVQAEEATRTELNTVAGRDERW